MKIPYQTFQAIMSRIITFPKFNSVTSCNFFFKNTKKKLVMHQNFVNNQFLYRRRPSSSSTGSATTGTTTRRSTTSVDKKTVLDVATKVLSCQEPDAPLSQGISTKHIPFDVVPKEAKSISPKLVQANKSELMTLINPYIKLTKPNLTILVTLSSICSYAISPLTVSVPQLLILTIGTAMCSGAANAINMGREPDFDRNMPRTAGRPVVRGLVTPVQSYQFAAITGSLGCTMLWFGVNPTVACMGFLNIVLYAWIYTSLKRKSIINTWVGAIVGAIPPLMGWAASSSLSHPAAWCLAGLLYAWQFPHFNALSHNIADQYKKAGYVMAAAENPMLNARVALRYSIMMFPLCFGLSYFGVTDWVFAFDSSIANAWLTYWAYKFWAQQKENHKNGKPTAEGIAKASIHARKLFWCSVWQLPAALILAMLHKKGQWDGLLHYFNIGETERLSPV